MGSEQQYGKLNIICENLLNNPHCPHGPTLLFERIQTTGASHKFYACSAYKSRKDCPFFIPYDSAVRDSKKLICKKETLKHSLKIGQSVKSSKERLLKIKELSTKERSYCHTCSCLLFPDEFHKHKTHDVCRNISDFLLNHPSQLLHLQTNSKGESQFIFTSKAVDVIINGLKKLNIRNVLCLGTPSIHERILECESGISSLFLDIDYRYIQFYDETQFCLFNMMNFYFFENPEAFERVKQFISTPDVVLIMDPPFSAREEPLVYTLSKFQSLFECNKKHAVLPVVWIFPYFKENEVLQSWHGMVMLDYDVTYLNQKQFKGSNKTSVVRIFTNLDPSKFSFPVEEGYHFCSHCKRWVSKFNTHCFKCGICPSKNGHPYRHCDMCSRCVKDYWCHCKKCGRCALKQHPCELWQDSKREVSRKRKIADKTVQNIIFKKRQKCMKKNKISKLQKKKAN